MMTDLRIEDVPKQWPESTCVECGKKMEAGQIRYCEYGGICSWRVPVAIRSYISRLEARIAELEAFAKKWGTDAPLNERRTMHEASVAYRKAAGVFPNPDGVKAILDK